MGSPEMVQLIHHTSLKYYSRATACSHFILNLSRIDTMFLAKVMSLRKPVGADTGQEQI